MRPHPLQRIDLPPVLTGDSRMGSNWRSESESGSNMGSGSLQLPPLSEVLRGVEHGRHSDGAHGGPEHGQRREQHGFPEAQSLAPSPGRLRPNYTSSTAYPSESSGSSEFSDRRSSYASPASSASLTSTKGSPILPPMASIPGGHRAPAPDYPGGRGLPPLYGGGEQPGRGAPSPPRHTSYPSPYPPQEYVGPYSRMPPTHHPGMGGYGGGYDNMGDYGDGKQKRRRGNLPKAVTDILRHWFQDHIAHPYPTEEEKQALMHQTGLTMSQISNWFINARRRSLPQMHRQGPEA